MAKRLTVREWALLRHDREIKGMTFVELSKKYGVAKSTIHSRADKEGWQTPKLSSDEVDRRVKIIKEVIKPSNSRRRPKSDNDAENPKKSDEKSEKSDKKTDDKSNINQDDTESFGQENRTGNPKNPKKSEKNPKSKKQSDENRTDEGENLDSFQEYLNSLKGIRKTDRNYEEGKSDEFSDEKPRNNSRPISETMREVSASEFYMQSNALHEMMLAFSDLEALAGGKYNPRYASVARRIAMLSGNQVDLADALMVHESTISRWLNEYPDFKLAWHSGRLEVDSRVAHAVYTCAVGYTIDMYDSKVVEGTIVEVLKQVHVPPNPRSQEYWLNNRQPEYWKSDVEYIPPPPPPLLDKEEKEDLYNKILDEASENFKACQGRADRLGLVMDNEIEE